MTTLTTKATAEYAAHIVAGTFTPEMADEIVAMLPESADMDLSWEASDIVVANGIVEIRAWDDLAEEIVTILIGTN